MRQRKAPGVLSKGKQQSEQMKEARESVGAEPQRLAIPRHWHQGAIFAYRMKNVLHKHLTWTNFHGKPCLHK